MVWQPPNLTLRWGDYLEPDADDDTKLVTVASTAYQAGLITKRAAIAKLQRVFRIENVDQFLEAVEEEAEAKRQIALTMRETMTPDVSDKTPTTPPGDEAAEPEESE